MGCALQESNGPARVGASASIEPVRNGIDVLRENEFATLAGRSVGLITNHTGIATDGRSTALLLHEAPNVRLRALFSPEHGFFGVGEGKIGDAVHAPTGLPIYSLYTTDRKPNDTHLRGIDTLVFDIQDIGTPLLHLHLDDGRGDARRPPSNA